MANVIIKSDERRAHENYVLSTFGKDGKTATPADRDAAATIAARSREAYKKSKRMEEKKHG